MKWTIRENVELYFVCCRLLVVFYLVLLPSVFFCHLLEYVVPREGVPGVVPCFVVVCSLSFPYSCRVC